MASSLDTARRLLVVKTHALGDVLMTTPALAALHERYPEAKITVLTTKEAAPLLALNPAVWHLITIDSRALFRRQLWHLMAPMLETREIRYDATFCFQHSRAMHRLLRLCASGPLHGFYDPEINKTPLCDVHLPWRPRETRPSADKYLDLARLVGADTSDLRPRLTLTVQERAQAQLILGSLRRRPDAPLVGLFPGGGANMRDHVEAKRWPAERWAAVARELSSAGLEVLVLGGKPDTHVVAEVMRSAGAGVLTAPQVGLREFAAVLGELDLLATNDSLPLHLAQALHVPTVALFGPSDSRAIVAETPESVFVRSGLACAPCYANEPFPACQLGTPQCMQAIEVSTVVSACRERVAVSVG